MGKIQQSQFDEMKRQFGDYGSWAIWSPQSEGGKVRSGISDISMFEDAKILDQLQNDFVIVALNLSLPCDEGRPFGNFHSSNPRNTDYRMRYAFKDTPLWGSYMTDILKGVCEVDSQKIAKNMNQYIDDIGFHAKHFVEEIEILKAHHATIVTLGDLSDNLTKFIIDKCNMTNKVIKIYHYAYVISLKKYRNHLIERISNF
jgi:hypothetical protein